jgi:hypothetical protein
MPAAEPEVRETRAQVAARLATLPPEQLLERERGRGQFFGLLALVSGLLVVAVNLVQQLAYADIPRVTITEALQESAGQSIGRAGLRTDQVLFYHDRALALIGLSILESLAAVGLGAVLLFLCAAAVGRGATIPALARMTILFGVVASVIGAIGLQIVAAILSSKFAGQVDHGTAAAHDALRSSALVGLPFVGELGKLSLTVAIVLISIGAMRVGLLTRFMGILGVIVGILFTFPISPSAFVVEALWLLALGVLIMRRWPRGMPPAWETGRAQPWPTQQQQREARDRAAGRAPAPATPAAARTERPSPATSNRKRRKRRG